jgi:hypothetical protein
MKRVVITVVITKNYLEKEEEEEYGICFRTPDLRTIVPQLTVLHGVSTYEHQEHIGYVVRRFRKSGIESPSTTPPHGHLSHVPEGL